MKSSEKPTEREISRRSAIIGLLSCAALAGSGCATLKPAPHRPPISKKRTIAKPNEPKAETQQSPKEIEKLKESWIIVYAKAVNILEKEMLSFERKHGRKRGYKRFYRLLTRKVYKITQDYRQVVLGEKVVKMDLRGSSANVKAMEIAHQILQSSVKESGIFEQPRKEDKVDMKRMVRDIERLMRHYKSLKK